MAAEQKMSQATIFVILGIVIVLAVFLIISANRGYIASRFEREISKASETAFASDPVKSFVEQCLSLVSKEALKKIGQQSGFLFVSQGGLTKDYDESDEGKIFALYSGIKATILDNSIDMPKLRKGSGENSIEDQLKTFVGNNIENCLDFSIFESRGLKIATKEKAVNVEVNENNNKS